jgi:23S rRNA pseudouridine1911/1915/1917 synthase
MSKSKLTKERIQFLQFNTTLPLIPPPPCEVLYDCGPCLAVNKPPGILTQAPTGIDSLEVHLKRWLGDRESSQSSVYLAIIHRLDRPASGVILFCRERNAAKKLSRQFEYRRVAKTYWAFVEGQVTPTEGTWVDYLYKIHGMAQAEVVPAAHAGAKEAILHYRVLCTTERGTWLEIELETGRTHQIRVQAASRGHPVVGDEQYGATAPFGAHRAEPRDRAIALHARSLAFTDPVTHEPVHLEAAPPPEWQQLELPLEFF